MNIHMPVCISVSCMSHNIYYVYKSVCLYAGVCILVVKCSANVRFYSIRVIARLLTRQSACHKIYIYMYVYTGVCVCVCCVCISSNLASHVWRCLTMVEVYMYVCIYIQVCRPKAMRDHFVYTWLCMYVYSMCKQFPLDYAA